MDGLTNAQGRHRFLLPSPSIEDENAQNYDLFHDISN